MIKIHPSELQLFQQCLVRDLRILTLLITALLFPAAGLKTAPEWQIFWLTGALCICSPAHHATHFSFSICLLSPSGSLSILSLTQKLCSGSLQTLGSSLQWLSWTESTSSGIISPLLPHREVHTHTVTVTGKYLATNKSC